ncbi:hypothetical protein LR48_Vigan07g015100 [Vigna angularis]|uniref:TIR domain-containing protein n=1 Tax=Phaseolus angularis TaxID=3914 RepID=A0A0L9UV63_PHAAN|nr:hypothetical protein LR48_Vigan07g015100 [Vigna angularis]
MEKHGEEEEYSRYDVFISFRGEDIRHTVLRQLREGLGRRGILSFHDDRDMRIGTGLSLALREAIEESNVFIVVFSENYASSTWCLDELVKIIQRTHVNSTEQIFLLPVFYHVDPSDIQKLRNSFGKHMTAHEKEFGKESQRVQAWKSALSEAANLPGMHITPGFEKDYIEEIVGKVQRNLGRKPLYTGQNPIGLEPHVEKVMSLLDIDDNTVKMLSIYGLGGIGKTELAKALYNKIVRHFDAASFLAGVREKSNTINGMEDLQKTLLSEMLEESETTNKGIYEIKGKLRRKKVLLVLDDVDDKEKLEKLAGGCDWFGPGSRIIITTRERDLLIVGNAYEMKELDEQHSLELFCWNAFGQDCPKTGFEDVSMRAVNYAKGLPLALKVLGSDLATLHGGSLDAWEDALEEYKKTPNKKIQDNVLQVCYDRLDDDAKQVFLDIACFFKGEKVEYVNKILKEFYSESKMKELVNKSLITIENGCLKMHDLIQDMGRQIVRQESPNPGKRSRIWDYEDVLQILTEDSGSDKIQGIMLDPPHQEKVKWSGTEFEKMKCLRILIVRNTSFSSEPEHLPNHLRLLDWDDYPSKSFPPKFHPKKIVVFNLPRSCLTFQEPFKKFPCLTKMDFSYNQCIIEIPDVSELQNLRELRVNQCRNLIAIHESVGFLKRLAHLSVSKCTKLQNVMSRMFLPSLEVFDLNLCESLGHFPEIMQEMTKSLKIKMKNTGIQELPESISNLTGLVSIDISNNKELKYLPRSVFMLPNLEELIVSENNFVSIPSCIKQCGDWTSLDLNGSKKLKKISEPTSLRILDVHHCLDLEEISELSSAVQKVDARFCFKLTKETSDMLWSQVKKGVGGIEMVMPFLTEIPEWFNFVGVGRIPRFWVRGKFPKIVVAMIFHFQNESQRDRYDGRGLVDLRLLINGRYAPRKGYRNFRIEAEHILLCDVGVLCSEKEWVGNAVMEHEWNLVQVSYDATSSLMISGWGAFVFEEGTNMEDLLFASPNNLIVNGDSTSVHEGNLEDDEDYVALPEGIAPEFLFEGIKDGIVEARKKFPSMDVAEICVAALKKNRRIEWTVEGMEDIRSAENRTYMTGVYGVLLEAKLRFPDLDVGAALTTVANRKGIKGTFKSPSQQNLRIPRFDWSTVTLPPSHDPLMQIFMMMMKQQNPSESELKTKTFWKLKESHQILRNRLSHITAPLNSASSSKNQYDELIQKFNMQYDAFVGKRLDKLYRVAKYERDSVVLKERAEELERLFNTMVWHQKSEEFGDVMTAMFLNGLRDGILEARAILLALRTDTQTHERVTDEAPNSENIA